MRYLIRNKIGKTKAHIWIHNDTACTMFSTNGLTSKGGYSVFDNTQGKDICKCCLRKIKSALPKKARKKNKKANPSGKFLTSWEWRTLRYEVITEFGRRCMCCGATPDDGQTVIHVDHIKPRYKYPKLALVKSNLQILCGVCNQGKGAWDETDFRCCVEDEDERLEREFQIELADKATTLQ